MFKPKQDRWVNTSPPILVLTLAHPSRSWLTECIVMLLYMTSCAYGLLFASFWHWICGNFMYIIIRHWTSVSVRTSMSNVACTTKDHPHIIYWLCKHLGRYSIQGLWHWWDGERNLKECMQNGPVSLMVHSLILTLVICAVLVSSVFENRCMLQYKRNVFLVLYSGGWIGCWSFDGFLPPILCCGSRNMHLHSHFLLQGWRAEWCCPNCHQTCPGKKWVATAFYVVTQQASLMAVTALEAWTAWLSRTLRILYTAFSDVLDRVTFLTCHCALAHYIPRWYINHVWCIFDSSLYSIHNVCSLPSTFFTENESELSRGMRAKKRRQWERGKEGGKVIFFLYLENPLKAEDYKVSSVLLFLATSISK